MKMSEKMKKLLSIVLCLLMLVQYVPMHAHAAEGGTKTIYLNAGGSGLWDQAGAWFVVHAWQDGSYQDIKMTKDSATGYYLADINPAYTNLLFVRMGPDYSELNWASLWNKTYDLIPGATDNLYTISGWVSGTEFSTGTWSHMCVYDNACDAVCNVCNKTREVGDHSWSAGTCTTCGAVCVHEGEELAYTEIEGGKQHKVTYAVCGAIYKETENHTFTGDICVCNYKCPHTTKTYAPNEDGTTHRVICATDGGCRITVEESVSHSYVNGACVCTAACNHEGEELAYTEIEGGKQHKVIYAVCGAEVKTEDHTYTDGKCACGYECPHTLDRFTNNEDGTHTASCACGMTTETKEHEYVDHRCVCGAGEKIAYTIETYLMTDEMPELNKIIYGPKQEETKYGTFGETVTWKPEAKTGYMVNTAGSTLEITLNGNQEHDVLKVYYKLNYHLINGDFSGDGYFDVTVGVYYSKDYIEPLEEHLRINNLEPSKPGYKFVGWKAYTDYALTQPYDGTTMPDCDLYVQAQFAANTYDAVFDANGGAWGEENTKSVPTIFGATIVAPAAPVRTGYIFNGWSPAVGKMDAEGKTFEAQWEECTHSDRTKLSYTPDESGSTHTVTCTNCGTVTQKNQPHTVGAAYRQNPEDANKHDAIYSCCGAVITADHEINWSESNGANCVSRSTCDVCKLEYGDINPNRHNFRKFDSQTGLCGDCHAFVAGAKTGGVYYMSLSDARDECAAGGTIVMLKTVEGEGEVFTCTSGETFTLDMNGYDFLSENLNGSYSSNAINVHGDLTIQNSGSDLSTVKGVLRAVDVTGKLTVKGNVKLVGGTVGLYLESEAEVDLTEADCLGWTVEKFSGTSVNVKDQLSLPDCYVLTINGEIVETLSFGQVATIDVRHTGGTQTCKGYKCETCGGWYGTADQDKHGYDPDTGICEHCGIECDHTPGADGNCSICGYNPIVSFTIAGETEWDYDPTHDVILTATHTLKEGYVAEEVYYTHNKEAAPQYTESTFSLGKGWNAGIHMYTMKVYVDGFYKTMDYTAIVSKIKPYADLFVFTAPTNLTYNGMPKAASVVLAEGFSGIGELTIWYRTAGTLQWVQDIPTGAGTYEVGVKVKGGTNFDPPYENRTITDESWTFTIEKATPTYTAPAARDLAYNGTAQNLVTAGTVNSNLVFRYKLGIIGDWSYEIPTAKDVMTDTLYWEIPESENYLGLSGEIEVEIKPAVITIIADDHAVTYGEYPELTYTVSGGIEAEPLGLFGALTVDSWDAGIHETKLGSLRLVDKDAFKAYNYQLKLVPGTLTVKQAKNSWVTEANVTDWAYGMTPNVPTADAYFGEEIIEYRLDSGTDADYKTVIPTLPGTYLVRIRVVETANWTGLSEVKTLNISQASLRVDTKDQTVTLGQSIDQTAYTVTGLVEGETAVVTLTASTDKVTADGIIVAEVVIRNASGVDVSDYYAVASSAGKLVVKPDTSKINGLTEKNVTSSDKENIKAVMAQIVAGDETAKEEWKDMTDSCEKLIKQIEKVEAEKTSVMDNAANFDKETVTSSDKKELEALSKDIENLLNSKNLTEAERKILTEAKDDVKAMLDVVDAAQNAAETEKAEKVENVTAENVKPEDKAGLADAKADLEKALKEYGDHYTEAEKKAIQTEIKRIEAAVATLEHAETVVKAVKTLPETVEPDDEQTEEKILAAKADYDALTDYEKSLVDETTVKKLNALVAALTDYEIIKGDGGGWTQGSGQGLGFTANGAFSKFTMLKVDGKEVDQKYYDAKSGSTIITLKESYLKNLSVGKHTITVVYTNGETSGTFQIKSASDVPATGDDSNILLYGSMFAVSLAVLAALFLEQKKRKTKNT